jgi:hypothetical protein
MHRGEQAASEPQEDVSNRGSSTAAASRPLPVVHEPSDEPESGPLHQPRPHRPNSPAIFSPEELSESLTDLNLQPETSGKVEVPPTPEAYELDGNSTPRASPSPNNPPPVSHSPNQEIVTSARYVPSAATYFPSTLEIPDLARGHLSREEKADGTQSNDTQHS